jgi:phage-related protein
MSTPPELAAESTGLSPKGAWLWLVELPVSDSQTLYLTDNNAAVTFDSITYNPSPLSVGGITETSEGALPEAVLTIGNANLFLSGQMAFLGNNGLVGRRVSLYRVHSDHLDTPTAKIVIRFWVKAAGVSDSGNVVTLQLGLDDLLNARVPIDFFSRGRCRFQYRGTKCGYTEQQKTVSAATNASPIVLTFTEPHRFKDGAQVVVGGVGGNTAANGTWTLTIVDATRISLGGSTGNGVYTSGGTASVSLPTCDRSLHGSNGCVAHDNNLRYGGAPSIPRSRTV